MKQDVAKVLERARQTELAYCKENIVYYVKNYVYIEDKDSEEVIVPFKLWKAQEQVLKDFEAHKMNLILKARQLGFSWLALSYASWLMLCKKPGATVVALSKTEEEAKELVRRLTLIFEQMPSFVRRGKWDGIQLESTVLELRLKFPDGRMSSMKAFPSASTGIRSFTANLVIFDEWAFQQSAETIWAGTFPVVNRPTGGQVIGLSTIERGTLFEELWLRNDKCFHKIFIPWSADPRRTEEWYETTKSALGDLIYSEYPATPEEALMVPGGAFFPEFKEAIHVVPRRTNHMQDRIYGSIDYGLDGFAAFWYAVDTRGEAVVYRQLYKKDLIVPEAARALLEANAGDNVFAWFAPPDLWNRNRDTGRSTAEVFAEMGIPLVKTSNIREQGCLNIKEYLLPYEKKLDQTGDVIKTARLRIEEGCAPDLVRCLMKIQRDKNKPNEYANDPHELTHCVDSLRAFCVGRPLAAVAPVLSDEDEIDIDDQIENFVEYGR